MSLKRDRKSILFANVALWFTTNTCWHVTSSQSTPPRRRRRRGSTGDASQGFSAANDFVLFIYDKDEEILWKFIGYLSNGTSY